MRDTRDIDFLFYAGGREREREREKGKALLKRLNLFDFGHGVGLVPTLTAEDVILAKLDAGRLKDKDDSNSIFESHADKDSEVTLDLNYLIREMCELKLSLPEECLQDAPTALRVVAKKRRRVKRSFP